MSILFSAVVPSVQDPNTYKASAELVGFWLVSSVVLSGAYGFVSGFYRLFEWILVFFGCGKSNEKTLVSTKDVAKNKRNVKRKDFFIHGEQEQFILCKLKTITYIYNICLQKCILLNDIYIYTHMYKVVKSYILV